MVVVVVNKIETLSAFPSQAMKVLKVLKVLKVFDTHTHCN